MTSLLRVFGFDSDKKILDLFEDMSLDPTRDYILMTLEKDSAKTADEAYKTIYKKIRPG